ncbi:DUF749 family protein [Methanocaldococcus indicus]|uniref:DUF749 family protein n=1 Tax=Methanocaldococcus indicus TaxID=213231 RepID=UPI003C6D8406
MFVAKLIAVFTVREAINSGYEEFIKLRAIYENRKYKDNDYVALFNIEGTTSYHVFFIDKDTKIEDIKNEFGELNVIINYDSEKSLKRFIDGLK